MDELMKDKWRFVYLPEWALDNIAAVDNPEDLIISRLDGDEEEEPAFDAYQLLSLLSLKESKVVQAILFDGKTFEATGKEMALSKQRIHQIYGVALRKLKGELNGPPK